MSGLDRRQRLIRRSLLHGMPHPVAAAWRGAGPRVPPDERVARLRDAVLSLLRVLTAVLLADYRRAPDTMAASRIARALVSPAPAELLDVVRRMADLLQMRGEPPPLLPESLAWARAGGGSTSLDPLVAAWDDRAFWLSAQAAGSVEAALVSALWLARYRPFQVVAERPTRHGTSLGRVRFLTGAADPATAPTATAEWSRTVALLPESVYLAPPAGDRVLELSPLLAVPQDRGMCHLLARATPAGELHLADRSGKEIAVLARCGSRTVPLTEWLRTPSGPETWPPIGVEQSGLGCSTGSADSVPGTMIAGRYRTVELAGRGPLADVLRCTDTATGEEVALELCHTAAARVAFLERSRAVAGVPPHPHLVQPSRVDVLDDGRPYAVRRLLEQSLLDRMDDGDIGRDEVGRWAVQVLSALEHLHAHGLLHAALKPENVLLDAAGDAVLSNPAVPAQDLSSSGALPRGIALHPAPEEQSGQPGGAKADVYRLARIVHEACVGAPPGEVVGAGIPSPLGSVVRAMAARSADERLDAAEARECLERTMGPGAAADERAAPDPLIGRRIDGRYTVLRRIGAGGMGTVYEARQISVDRHVALKVMRKDRWDEQHSAGRFLREARAASQLTCESTITIFDFGQTDDGLLYISMELLDGRPLTQLVRSGEPIPPAQMVAILSAVCDSLAEAHAAGLVHRDLKPDNILLCNRHGRHDVVKVLDFGLAKQLADPSLSDLTTTGAICGTPAYVSPEAATGAPVDQRADIYSLGVILYEMLAGKLPFEAETPFGVVFSHAYDPPPPVEERAGKRPVPAPLADLLPRLLAKDPAGRYSGAAEVKDALRDALSAWRGGAARPAPAPRGTRVRSRGAAMGWAAAVLASGLLAAGAYVLVWPTDREGPGGSADQAPRRVLRGGAAGSTLPRRGVEEAPARLVQATRRDPDPVAPAARRGADDVARAHVFSYVWLKTRPPGATVFLSGALAGVTPMKIALPPLPASVQVRIEHSEFRTVAARLERDERHTRWFTLHPKY